MRIANYTYICIMKILQKIKNSKFIKKSNNNVVYNSLCEKLLTNWQNAYTQQEYNKLLELIKQTLNEN